MASRTRPRSNNKSLPNGYPAIRSAKERFAAAVKHHLANELVAAEQNYRAALHLEPHFPEALNNLGALIRPRDAKAAFVLFVCAVVVCPNFFVVLFFFVL